MKDLDHNQKVYNIVLNGTLQWKRKNITIILINANYSSASEFFTLTVPYRTVPFQDLPFPRFGLKKPRHRSLKPYRFPFFKEKRLTCKKKTIRLLEKLLEKTIDVASLNYNICWLNYNSNCLPYRILKIINHYTKPYCKSYFINNYNEIYLMMVFNRQSQILFIILFEKMNRLWLLVIFN